MNYCRLPKGPILLPLFRLVFHKKLRLGSLIRLCDAEKSGYLSMRPDTPRRNCLPGVFLSFFMAS